MSRYKELLSRKAELEKQIAEVRNVEIKEVVAGIFRAMSDHDISLAELNAAANARRRYIQKGVPKYRDPVSGSTWSGRGRRPGWFRKEEENSYLVR